MTTTRRAGLTIVEVLAAAASFVTLIAAAAAMRGDGAPGGHGQRTVGLSVLDGTQINGIHKSLVLFSREFADRYPRPGLIDRRPVDVDGVATEIPGRGDEDTTRNTTADLYSVFVMNNYFKPEFAISPLERNPRVTVKSDYAYTRYDPRGDVFWDESFVADLEKGASASYAHLAMHGLRRDREWRTTMNASYPVLGNRGPLAGERDAGSHTCGPHGHWAGNLVFNDNRVELLTSMTASQVTIVRAGGGDDGPADAGKREPDNFFAMETGPAGADVIISFTKAMTGQGPTLQHD